MVSPFAGQFLTEEVLPLRALRSAGRFMDAASRQGAVASRDAERIDLHPEGHVPGGGRDGLIHGTISGRGGCSRRSDPGWIRTSDLRDVNAASTPLLHRISSSRAGRSRTCLAPLIRRRPRRSVHGPIRTVGAQGVEPRLPGSEPGRLPLQHTPDRSARCERMVAKRKASP